MGSAALSLQPRAAPAAMDPKLVLPAALLLLACLFQPGTGIKCYVCNSYEQALCADPFFHEDGTVKSESSFEKECDDDTDSKKHFCRKIYQNVRGDERVIRSCGWIKDERERECYTTVLEEYNTEVCACDGDNCNSASMSSISVIAVLSTMALGYLIH